jgi:hypothetical protein
LRPVLDIAISFAEEVSESTCVLAGPGIYAIVEARNAGQMGQVWVQAYYEIWRRWMQATQTLMKALQCFNGARRSKLLKHVVLLYLALLDTAVRKNSRIA